MLEMASDNENLELTEGEHRLIMKYDSCHFGFLKLDKPDEAQTKLLLEKGVKFYEYVIKAAVRQAKRDKSGQPAIESAIFCRLGHLLLLLEQYEKALSAYQKYYHLEENHWKNAPFLYGLGFVYFHFNAYQL
ncbi:hypothetical protein DPMN_135945, partial [Dreissena polymorpha]